MQLTVSNRQSAPLELELFDHVPPGMTVEQLPQRVRLQSGEHCRLAYRVQPNLRGQVMFQRCDVRLLSPLGLWRSRRPLTLHSETRVPRLRSTAWRRTQSHRPVAEPPWRAPATTSRARSGVFTSYASFAKATPCARSTGRPPRARTPIAREYQDERDQQIMLMLDCGRRMRSQDGDLSHFDHALNASLLLAYAALRQAMRSVPAPSPVTRSAMCRQRRVATTAPAAQ